MPDYFLAGNSSLRKTVVFIVWFLYALNKGDIACLLVSFRGVSRWILSMLTGQLNFFFVSFFMLS